jgi:hypothetical protein
MLSHYVIQKRFIAIILFAALAFAHAGVSRSQWAQTNCPLSRIDQFIVSDTNFLARSGNSVARSTDEGLTWSVTSCHDGAIGFAIIDSFLFFSDYSYVGAIYRTHDWGETWDRLGEGLSEFETYSIASDKTNLYLGTDYTIYRSSDSYTTWTELGDGGPRFNWVYQILPDDSNILIIAGSDTQRVLRTTDGGATWRDLDLIEPFKSYGSNILDRGRYYYPTLSQSCSYIFISFGRSLANDIMFASSDKGIHWFARDLPETQIAAFARDSNTIFSCSALHPDAIFRSSDNGFDWVNVGSSLGRYIRTMAIIKPYIFVGTDSGIWRRPLSDFGISAVAPVSTVNKTELQTYPNPFSQSTQISFTPQASGYAEVSVFNQLGVEVSRLFSGELNAGEQHTFTWNPSALPDGMYECLIRMNGQVETVPMVLMR